MEYNKYFTHNMQLYDFLENKKHLKLPFYLLIGEKVRIINNPLIGAQKAVKIFGDNEDRDSMIGDFWE